MADVSSRRRGGFTGGRGRAPRSAPYLTDSAPSGLWKREVDSGSRSTDGPSERLVVTNLHYEVMPSDLKGIFESIGNLAREPTIRVRYQPSTFARKAESGKWGAIFVFSLYAFLDPFCDV